MYIKTKLWPVPLRAISSGVQDSGSRVTAFTRAAGWIAVVAVFYAPWAFGSRPYAAALLLAFLLFCSFASWFCGCCLEKRWPTVPQVCWGAVLYLAIQAGASLFNPQSAFHVASGSFLPNPLFRCFLPTTVDLRSGRSFTVEMLAYLCVIPVVADLARFPCWRWRYVSAIALNGVLVALTGLSLRAGCLPQINAYLVGRPWAQGQIFGPFDYHGNAGAFLNLVLPATAATAAAADGTTRRIFWQCSVGMLYIALFVNISRAALVIGVVLSPFCLWLMLRDSHVFHRLITEGPGRWKLGLGSLTAVVVAGAVLALNWQAKPIRRLRGLPNELRQPEYPRYLQSRAAWEMVRERPLFGAGVGSYKLLVQTSSIQGNFFAPRFNPGEPFTVLSHAHEDYLQTLAEWGWIGFGAWAIIVAGAFVRLFRWLRRTRFAPCTAVATAIALISVYLHAIGDCPLQIPALQFYVALYLGLAWSSPQH